MTPNATFFAGLIFIVASVVLGSIEVLAGSAVAALFGGFCLGASVMAPDEEDNDE